MVHIPGMTYLISLLTQQEDQETLKLSIVYFGKIIRRESLNSIRSVFSNTHKINNEVSAPLMGKKVLKALLREYSGSSFQVCDC